jgi:hypothetical protein
MLLFIMNLVNGRLAEVDRLNQSSHPVRYLRHDGSIISGITRGGLDTRLTFNIDHDR